MGILDELDALVALGGTPFVAKELLAGFCLRRATDDQHRVGLIAGHDEVVELVTLDGLHKGQIAFVDFDLLLCLLQGLEPLGLVEIGDLGATVEFFEVNRL